MVNWLKRLANRRRLRQQLVNTLADLHWRRFSDLYSTTHESSPWTVKRETSCDLFHSYRIFANNIDLQMPCVAKKVFLACEHGRRDASARSSALEQALMETAP